MLRSASFTFALTPSTTFLTTNFPQRSHMSSIITAVPSGLITDWCIKPPYLSTQSNPQQCANSTRGTLESDFETICCDGTIVNTVRDLRLGGPISLTDLICCRLLGPQAGGLLPLPTNAATECASGTPTPLASLAATNSGNVQGYLVTYTSASFGSGTIVGDYVPTQTPYCLWAYTAGGAVLTNVTVAVAEIATLSSVGVVGTVTPTTRQGGSSSGTGGTASVRSMGSARSRGGYG